ncbi:MAG: nicotinate-nucleotide diphosphorylase (carboxylating) [Chloroflexi bacterium RBG_16_50_9]|nr:MAG: nicotinate-nucleotide diphosphorylase (carboxylating) [Chloroflexi bacterium RBG_16_50_9]
MSDEQIDSIVDLALTEDISHGDITSEALIPPDLSGKASVLIKEKGVLAGSEIAGRVFQHVEPSLKIAVLIKDGARIQPGDIAATVTGKVTSILKAERTALNFLQRLSGIASLTSQYVAEIQGLSVKIYDTRKTTPGLRSLEKYAVRMGGGQNHRWHLGDAVLIKDNHAAVLRALGMNLKDIVAKARQNVPPGVTVEVEVTNVQEALTAIKARADIIMLDNMNLEEMREAVKLVAGKARIEASGGITLANIRQVAMTGVDMISIGALTHSFKSLDICLELEPQAFKLI